MEMILIFLFGLFIFFCLHEKGGWWMVLAGWLACSPLLAEEAQIIETYPNSVYPKQFPNYTMRQQGRETYVYRNFQNSIFHDQFPSYIIRPVRGAGTDKYEIRETYPRSVYPKQFPVQVVRGSSNAIKSILNPKKP